MGFFDKLKNFGSKIVKGVKRGWDFVKNKVAPVVRKVLPAATAAGTAIGGAIGGPGGAALAQKIGGAVDSGLRFIGR